MLVLCVLATWFPNYCLSLTTPTNICWALLYLLVKVKASALYPSHLSIHIKNICNKGLPTFIHNTLLGLRINVRCTEFKNRFVLFLQERFQKALWGKSRGLRRQVWNFSFPITEIREKGHRKQSLSTLLPHVSCVRRGERTAHAESPGQHEHLFPDWDNKAVNTLGEKQSRILLLVF